MVALLFWSQVYATTPTHIQNEIPNARLAGQGIFRWFGLEIYNAQLWVSDRGFRSDAPTLEKFALNLRYSRKLYGDKIAESSLDEIKKLGLGTQSQQQSWLASMRTLFPNVEEGTHITGIFIPNLGARFFLNGKLHGELLDAQFAQAFFAIWLSPNTSAPKLRNALLSNASSIASPNANPTISSSNNTGSKTAP